ncbi:MAG TPA: ATP-binding protein [Ktedonobacterales bacterium]
MPVGLLTSLPHIDESHLTFGLVCVVFVIALLVVALKPSDRRALTFCGLLILSALVVEAGRLLQDRVAGADAVFAGALGLQVLVFFGYISEFAASGEPDASATSGTYDTFARVVGIAINVAPFCSACMLIQVWLGEPLPTIGSVMLCAAQVAGLGLGLVVLGLPLLRARSMRVRYISTVVWVGAVVAYLPALLGTTTPLLLGQRPMLHSSAAALLLLALPLALGFASIRWRRGSLLALIDRVSVYVLLGLFLLVTDLVLVVSAQRLVQVPVTLPSELLTLGVACIAVATYTPLRDTLQRSVDTLLYRDYYEFGPTLQRFSQELATLRDQEGVANLLLDGLAETLNLSGIAFIALPEGLDQRILGLIEAEDLRARRAYAIPEGRAEVLGGLASLNLATLKETWRSPVLQNPWPGCAALVSIGAAQTNEVLALLVIGSKRTNSPLRADDLALLATLANQSATALANAVLFAGLTTSLKQVQISTEQLVTARAEQQLLLRKLVDADERQRETLARELHDDALQEVLYLIRHSDFCTELADALESQDTTHEDAAATAANFSISGERNVARAATLHRLRQELYHLAERSAVAEQKLRALCLGLYPALLSSIGLAAALEDLGHELAGSTRLSICVECTEDVRERALNFDVETALHIYRIVQEALRNAAKHAHATRARVRLSTYNGVNDVTGGRLGGPRELLVVEIEDDGRGLALPVDYAALLHDGHLGLAGMRERADRIGGTLALRAAASGGTRVVLQVALAYGNAT